MSIEDLTSTAVRKICPACSREFAGSEITCKHDGNPLQMLPSDPYVGRILAEKYLVVKSVGSGGMGTVYLAKHELMNRRVAIKMLRAQYVQDEGSVKRFQLEARALGKLEHNHIINTHDHGYTVHGQPYIVMEFLQGRSLAEEVKEHKGLPVGRTIDIFDQVCDALDYAHKKGVLHRDLKPGNIMLLTDKEKADYVKVVDFGVAKLMDVSGEEAQSLTQQGEVCGSPVYMSPEQCLGQDLDRRADVYSMGVVIFETLTGKLPLLGKNMMETMGKHIHEEPPSFQQVRPDLYIPERLEKVVRKALSKKPEDRHQTMAQLREDLLAADPRPKAQSSASTNLDLRAKISSVALPSDETPKSTPVAAIVAGVAVAVVVLCGGGFLAFNAMQKPVASPSPPVTSTNPAAVPTPTGTVTPANPAVPAATTLPQTPVNSTPVVQPVPQNTSSAVNVTPVPQIKTPVHVIQRPVVKKIVKKPVEVRRSRPAPVLAAPANNPFTSLGNERSWVKKKM